VLEAIFKSWMTYDRLPCRTVANNTESKVFYTILPSVEQTRESDTIENLCISIIHCWFNVFFGKKKVNSLTLEQYFEFVPSCSMILSRPFLSISYSLFQSVCTSCIHDFTIMSSVRTGDYVLHIRHHFRYLFLC